MSKHSSLIVVVALAAAPGCSKSVDRTTAEPAAKLAEAAPASASTPAAPATAPGAAPAMPAPGAAAGTPPALFEGTGRMAVGGGAGELALVDTEAGVEVVLTASGRRQVIATLPSDVASQFAIRAEGDGAIVIDRANYADTDSHSTRVWPYRWDAARATMVAGDDAFAAPDEVLPDWVPASVRALHDGTDGLIGDEQLCLRGSDGLTNRAIIGPGVRVLAVCDFLGSSKLVVLEGARRTEHAMTEEARVYLAPGAPSGVYVIEEIGGGTDSFEHAFYELRWTEGAGTKLRPLKRPPALLKRLARSLHHP